MDLYEFDQRLRMVAPQDSKPFFCEGSPMGCEVFIVGLNPGLRPPAFWPYWDVSRNVSYGFHKERWLQAYGSWTPTRHQIEILVAAISPIGCLSPLRCLETNVFAACSNRLADLPRERRSTEVFDLLVDVVRPRSLLVHGVEAVSHVERLAGCSIPLNQYLTIRLAGRETFVYARHHLSFQLSRAACRDIGTQLRQEMTARIPAGPPAQQQESHEATRSAMKASEGPRAGITSINGAVKANWPGRAARLTGREIKVLTALRDNSELDRQQLRERTGMGEKGWSKLLGAATRKGGGVQGGGLEGEGLILTVRDAAGRAVIPLRYAITEAGHAALARALELQ